MKCFQTDASKLNVVVSGYITNPRASQVFYISAKDLIKFYNLDPNDCCIVPVEFRNNYKAHPNQLVFEPKFKQKNYEMVKRARPIHYSVDFAH